MTSPEAYRRKLAIDRTNDLEELRKLAHRYHYEMTALADGRGGSSNYTVVDRFKNEIASGTRDYCIGYVQGRIGLDLYGGHILSSEVVMCGDYQVYPDPPNEEQP